jgi:methylenetetrahydrofolate reductase (NADPH)
MPRRICRASGRRATTSASCSQRYKWRKASTTWWRCAATCPRVWSIPATCATPTNWSSSCAQETGDWFHIEVAAYPEVHPQARSAEKDLQAFVRKMKAGADSAITQYFYNTDAYFAFVDDARAMGVDAPIYPGIMPIANFSKISRFSEACGAEIPRWMRRKFEGFGDDAASVRAYGLDVVTTLCERLLAGGAPGLHFYTLNQAGLTSTIWQRLGL